MTLYLPGISTKRKKMSTIHRFHRYFLAGLLLVLGTGCGKDFLEEKPRSNIRLENFYANESEAFAGVVAAYDVIGKNDYYINILRLADLPTDLARNNAFDPLNEFSWDANNGTIGEFWTASYSGIGRCNVAINRISKAAFDEGARNRLIAEARFLRAWFYFTLVKFFGNVPLIDFEINTLEALDKVFTTSNVNTHEQVWNLIFADLYFAEQYLPDTPPQPGRVTKLAPKALLVKVFLQRAGLATHNKANAALWGVENVSPQEWDSAYYRAKAIIDNKAAFGVDLFADFTHNFIYSQKNGREHIFSIQKETVGFEAIGSWVNAITSPDYMQGRYQFAGELALNQLWIREGDTAKDVRYQHSLIVSYTKGRTTVKLGDSKLRYPLAGKYLIGTTAETERITHANLNIPILRYADVLLSFSEAANEMGAADRYRGINEVRNRAKLPPLAGLGQESFRQAIINERIFELCFEGHGHSDYTRHGILVERNQKAGYKVESFQHVFPIPLSDIQLYPSVLRQNTGY